jgi:hypothetical protein
LSNRRRPALKITKSKIAKLQNELADVAQLVEHSLGKGEVTSSILVIGSRDLVLIAEFMTTGFEQAGIKIEKEAEFAALKQSIERLLSASLIEKFFKKLDKNNVRVREFEMVLSKRLMEQLDENLAKSGKSAQSLYEALSMTDKGQMREFYLTKIEEVNPEIRARFQKIYRYY